MKKRQMRKKKRRMKANALNNKGRKNKLKPGDLVEFQGKKQTVKSVTAGIAQLDNGFCVDESKLTVL